MKRINVIIFILFLFLIISNDYSQWQQITTNTNEKINSLWFTDPVTGYFVTESGSNTGSIYKTTNGGLNWQYTYSALFSLKSIYFSNSQNGFIAGKEHILVTSNGGISWNDKYKPDYEIYDVRDVTSNYVLGVGFKISSQNTTILQSYDGGNNWTSQLVYSGSTSRLFSIRFTNSNTGFTCGEFGTVMRIINGGSWNFLVTGTTNHLYSLSFLNYSTGFAAGANSTLVKTTNSGTNWSIYNFGFSNIDFRSIVFVDATLGFIAGNNGFIAKSTNYGLNWTQQNTNINSNLNTILFLNRDTLFAAGDSGVLLRTVNGGVTGINFAGNEIPKSFNLYQNYPNPFNPSTRIRFDIPKTSRVKITVYNELGKEIINLLDKDLQPGEFFTDWNSSNAPSGVYFCRFSSNSYVETIRMVVVK